MKKTFEYFYTYKAEDAIEVEDIGNCCLQAFNDRGYFWLLDIQTQMGWCNVKTFGPIYCNDYNYFGNGFNFNFKKIEYKESKLSSIIEDFITEPKKVVTQVIIIKREELMEILSNIDLIEMGDINNDIN